MLILLSAAAFSFGLPLFSLCLAVWLLGVIIRIAILLYVSSGLLLVWAGIAFAGWLQRSRATPADLRE